jgi:uncharacterized hydantoinase/oxoprolinase family protein
MENVYTAYFDLLNHVELRNRVAIALYFVISSAYKEDATVDFRRYKLEWAEQVESNLEATIDRFLRFVISDNNEMTPDDVLNLTDANIQQKVELYANRLIRIRHEKETS